MLAFKAENGELAWKKKDIPVVLEQLIKLNLGLLGGEAWAIEDGAIWGTLPMRNGGTGVFHWGIDRKKNEAWDDFVDRSVKESLRAISALDAEKEVVEKLKDSIYYTLCYIEEEEFRS